MRVIVLVFVAIMFSTQAASAYEECTTAELGTSACTKKIGDNLTEWNAGADKLACEMRVDQCHIVMNAIAENDRFRKDNAWLLIGLALALGTAAGAAIDSDNRWQGALVGGLGGWFGVRIGSF